MRLIPLIPYLVVPSSILLVATLTASRMAQAGLDEVPAIRQLREELATTANKDSIRFLLAQAYRNAGTVDGRDRALSVLEDLRPKMYHDPRYHMEIARTYFEGGRRADARRSLERAIRLDPSNIEARLSIARMIIPLVIRFGDIRDVKDQQDVIDGALRLDPANRDALYSKSLSYCLARGVERSKLPEKSLAGLDCTEMILQRDPHDVAACLLHAVHCADLGRLEEADYYFRLGLSQAPDSEKIVYYMPTYSAPDSMMTQLASLPPEERLHEATAYWNAMNPDPRSPVNQSLIEYWRRMTLADLYYGDPAHGVRGWRTPRGETLIRYGPPHATVYETGFWFKLTFVHPAQRWYYAFSKNPVVMRFEDANLQGHFVPSNPGADKDMTKVLPSVPFTVYPGEILNCYVTGAGHRGEAQKTHQAIFVGAPRWGPAGRWWHGATAECRVLNTEMREVAAMNLPLASSAIYELADSAETAVLSQELSLTPGDYSVIVRLHGEQREGSFCVPLRVRGFRDDSLQVSDLRLGLPDPRHPGGTGDRRSGDVPFVPNPGGLVYDGRLDVAFEIYNLVPDAEQMVRYQIRYAVIPRENLSEVMRPLIVGDSLRRPPSLFGEIGRRMAQVDRTAMNFSEMLFPPNEARLARHGRGKCSFQVDADRLKPGLYSLLVTVRDLRAGKFASTEAPFRVLSRDEVETLFGLR